MPTCQSDAGQSPSTSQEAPDRLFVPLAAAPFHWFSSGGKEWELRKLGRQYTPAHVWPGRDVELRLGYRDRDSAIWGQIVEVIEASNLMEFFDAVHWKVVLPESDTRDQAIEQAIQILNISDPLETPVLGFRVERASA